jgi:hypothetical protein
VSQRRNIEDAFRRYLLARQGLSYHWRGMAHELVVTDKSGHALRGELYRSFYDEADVMARELFEVFLNRLDGNRLALEIVSAYGQLGGGEFGDDAVRDARRAGEAVMLALATHETYPEEYRRE